MRLRLIIAVLVGGVMGGAVLVGRFATAETPDTLLEPQVTGRIVAPIFAETLDGGGATVFCEYDAQVNSRNGTVEEVTKEGTRHVPIGGDLVNWVPVPPQEGVESTASEDLRVMNVYWDKDGTLRAGCAPESVVIEDDGTKTTVGELHSARSTGVP